MSTKVYVAGVGSTKFGVLPGRKLQSLAVEAAHAALRIQIFRRRASAAYSSATSSGVS